MLNNRLVYLTMVLIAGVILLGHSDAIAQSSLGLGRSEQAIRPDGLFAGILFWIQQQQQAFYKAMTTSLAALKNNESTAWYLIGLSFAYGVFHAAGPGHGKAVISSYVLANEVAAKRGIALSFASAMLQGITAILVISAIMLFLRGTGIKTNNLAGSLEITSYFLVMMLGLYLLWTKLFRHRPAVSAASANDQDNHDHGDHHHHDGHHHHHHHHHDDCGCGHSHAADPSTLSGKFGGREAFTAIMAVGLRPCSGAIIVLTFAFLNGLFVAGILSTFAMSLGTGITVATLATLAVTAKNTALKVAGMQNNVVVFHRIVEIGGAALVFVIGFLLFSASLTA